MKRAASLCLSLVLVLGLAILDPQPLFAQDPDSVLEKYSFKLNKNSTINLLDESFGGGTAKASIISEPNRHGRYGTRDLSLHVWRQVAPDEITFALLVFRVEVRGYGPSGTLLYSWDDPDGFVFGDSASGGWIQRLESLPIKIKQLEITFIGNYE